jgi:hypothetical protein
VNTADLCRPVDGKAEGALTMNFVPFEQLLQRIRPLELAMHHALGGPRMHPEILCVAVYERIVKRER